MKVDMILPQVGESINEATISKWRKAVGERVEKDETILDISTEKVDTEVTAPASGVLVEIKHKEGEVVPVKTIIAVIDTAGTATKKAGREEPQREEAPSVVQQQEEEDLYGEEDDGPQEQPKGRFYSPLAQTMAFKFGISEAELEKIQGSGQGGRVTKQDLLDYVDRRQGKEKPAPPISTAKGTKTEPMEPAIEWGSDGTKAITMDAMRHAIAEHMSRSKHTSPHVYSVQEVDVTAISKWRRANQSEFQKQEGFKLSFTPFFLEAAVRAILKFPYVNSSVEGKKIILRKHINLGCAVAVGDPAKGTGLIVPVIQRAEERNLVGLARALQDLALRAREKKLLPDDVTGGTFTVTNPGVFGTLIGTPIINQPQVAILCLGAIEKRPVVIDDMIAIRERCYLTLTYDHRVIDGAISGNFLGEVKRYLESWPSDKTLSPLSDRG